MQDIRFQSRLEALNNAIRIRGRHFNASSSNTMAITIHFWQRFVCYVVPRGKTVPIAQAVIWKMFLVGPCFQN
jgi:hypothetical protein